MTRTVWTPADGVAGALELVDGPAAITQDHVPSVDQAVPVATYADWRKEDTRVIACRIANDLYRDERFESREEAKATIQLRHGRILEENYVPGRAFFRVLRVVKSV